MGISTALPKVTVTDDLERSRLTAFFRLFLAIPHFIWIGMWGAAMLLFLPVMWVITLVKGIPNAGLHEVYGMYLRYTLHVYAYVSLAADPYPGFLGQRSYPVDLTVPPPERQNRWTVGFRLVLALPPFFMAGALGSGVVTSGGTAWAVGVGPAVIAGFLAWFAVLANGRMPAGLRDLIVWALGYAIQVAAYFFVVTGAYPDTDPRAVPLRPRPPHPVALTGEDDPRRSRLTVLFRFVLVMPHVVWITLWSAVVLVAIVPFWLVALALGRLPEPLHRFLAAFVRYSTHFTAFAYLAAGPFPGFTGAAGSYPLDLQIAPPERQSRWTIGLRWLLAFPAFMIAAGLGTAMAFAAMGAWFFALVKAEMPRGLHATLRYCTRYSGQAYAYALLLTGVYAHSGPSEEEREPEALTPAPDATTDLQSAPIPGPLAELEAR